MKIRITFDVDENDRRGVQYHYDAQGEAKASYEDMRRWIVGTIEADLEALKEDRDGTTLLREERR